MSVTHQLIKGDSLKILAEMTPMSVDFVFADPPYFLSNGGLSVSSGQQVSVNKGIWDKSRGKRQDSDFQSQWISLSREVLKPNGTIAISGTRHSIYHCAIALEEAGFKILNEIIWFKPNGAPNLTRRNFAESHESIIWARKSANARHIFNYELMKFRDSSGDKLKNAEKQMRDVWSISTTPAREKTFGRHPTQKPLELVERILLAATTEGQMVLDPFCGSGTTGVAAIKNGRSFIGIDKYQKYVNLANKRIEGIRENE
jgi:site-specific DNA-methyltransferase (adenine-specific)